MAETGTGFSATLTHGETRLVFSARGEQGGVLLSLELHNIGPQEQTVQLGFHPYFAVADIAATTVQGLGAATALDQVSAQTVKLDGSPITFAGEYDRIVASTDPATISDGSRRITVTSSGADHTVVWNPGPAKTRAMDDLGDEDYRRFVCVEPALLGMDLKGVQVAPGGNRRLSMTVTSTADSDSQ